MLEAGIDDAFNNSELIRHPFGVIFNSLCQVIALSENENENENFADCFVYIFEKMKSFPQISEDECWSLTTKVKTTDWSTAYQCATLNQVFPLIHRNIYSLTKENGISFIKYRTEAIGKIELRDEIVTRLSLPIVKFSDVVDDYFYRAMIRRLDRGERLNVLKGINPLIKFYNRMPKEFEGEELICPPVYKLLGFSDKESFCNIRNAFFAISEAMLRARKIVEKHIKLYNINESSSQAGNLFKGLSMVVVDKEDLKKVVLSVCKVGGDDYDNFCVFFMHDPNFIINITRTCMPVFWSIGSLVYFSPFFIPRLLSPRNLLMIAKNNSKLSNFYGYDENISQHLEKNLIKRANNLFSASGFQVYAEKDFEKSEIDLLVFCDKTNMILQIQAKATLPPDGAREVERLDGRIQEAKSQLDVFNSLTANEQVVIAQECFPGSIIGEDTTFISGILINSSFGTYKSWNLIEDNNILPLNCNILKNTINGECNLSDLSKLIWSYIHDSVEGCHPKLNEKQFNHSKFTIKQEKWEFDTLKLFSNAQILG